MHIQLELARTHRSTSPLSDAHNIVIPRHNSVATPLNSSQMEETPTLSTSDVKPNISGYVIIGVVLTILVLVLIGIFMVRRCGGRHLFVWMYSRKPTKSAGSSSATLNDPEKTPQMSSRTGMIRVPPPIHSQTPAIAAQHESGTPPTDDNGESSTGRANGSSLSDTPNSVVRQANHLPATDFVAPTSHHKHFFDERFLTASTTSSNRTIRPHGIPLTPVPEDASATFSPYFEVDEQTLYGTSQNSLIQH